MDMASNSIQSKANPYLLRHVPKSPNKSPNPIKKIFDLLTE